MKETSVFSRSNKTGAACTTAAVNFDIKGGEGEMGVGESNRIFHSFPLVNNSELVLLIRI